LATPVKMVRDDLGEPITLAFPCGEGREPTSLLRQACTKWFKVRESALKRSMFGVSVVVATENPMDLDYRTLRNAGLWCIGRLQTDADRARVVDG
jgi:hypothetical protein